MQVWCAISYSCENQQEKTKEKSVTESSLTVADYNSFLLRHDFLCALFLSAMLIIDSS